MGRDQAIRDAGADQGGLTMSRQRSHATIKIELSVDLFTARAIVYVNGRPGIASHAEIRALANEELDLAMQQIRAIYNEHLDRELGDRDDG